MNVADRSESRPADPRTDPTVALEGITVLVVEDSPSDERLVVAALVEAGVDADHVTCVPTLREARRALVRHPFGCVLLDLCSPMPSASRA